jgi:DnaA N-terminal domain
VLSYSRTKGSVRLLLAALAALAGEHIVVDGLSTEDLCAAAGTADRTYRRVRAALLTSGEVSLETAGGGRANTNRWLVRDPRAGGRELVLAPRRRAAPNPSVRPLLAAVAEREPAAGHEPEVRHAAVASDLGWSGTSEANVAGSAGQRQITFVRTAAADAGQSRTFSTGTPAQTPVNPGPFRGKPRRKPLSIPDPSAGNPGTNPAETPAETPAPNARTGREPKNPGTFPPNPPDGGSHAGSVRIVEDYVTDRGRRRKRPVVVELAAIRRQLAPPAERDVKAWRQIRAELRRRVGESTFEIWPAELELAAVDPSGCLVLTVSSEFRAWVAERYARPLDAAGRAAGRDLRIATDREEQLLGALRQCQPTSQRPAVAPRWLCLSIGSVTTRRRPYDNHHTNPYPHV